MLTNSETTQRYAVLNIWADAVSMEQALAKVSQFVEGRNGGSSKSLHTIFAANPEKNFSVPKDPLLYRLF